MIHYTDIIAQVIFQFYTLKKENKMKTYSTKCGSIFTFRTVDKPQKTQATAPPACAKNPGQNLIEKNCHSLFNSAFMPLKSNPNGLCQWVGQAWNTIAISQAPSPNTTAASQHSSIPYSIVKHGK